MTSPASRCYCLTVEFWALLKFAREASLSRMQVPEAIARVLEGFCHDICEIGCLVTAILVADGTNNGGYLLMSASGF
jgi:hypothetical protein